MVDSKEILAVANEITGGQQCLSNDLDNTKIRDSSNFRSNKNITNSQSSNMFSYIGYGMVCLLLVAGVSDSMAVDLGKFGKGVTDPMVKFASAYWVYGAGIGGIATALLSEGDGRVRIIRGGTVFLGASSICMGILATLPPQA